MSMQKRAFELNSALFIPPEGIQYHRMAGRTETQSRSALRFLKEFDNSNSYVIHVNAICDRLAFGVEPELVEQAIADVASVIGISSSRPEKTIGKGPDCLWLGDNGVFFIIEVKSDVELDRKEIYKSETEQLIHSCEWFKQEYPGKTGRPFMVHPATKTAHEAVFPSDGRVITPDVLQRFVASVRSFAVALATEQQSAINEKIVYTQLEMNKLLFDRCLSDAKKVL